MTSPDSSYHLISTSRENRKTQNNSRLVTVSFVFVASLALVGVFLSGYWSQRLSWSVFYGVPPSSTAQIPTVNAVEDLYDSSRFVRGLSTPGFRDNLLADKKYITSWISAGWTNDVITYINLIYMGLITDRIPILPPFIPSHIGTLDSVPPIAFGEVFDLPRLRSALRSPILEWHEVKNTSNKEIDEVGCWNTWEAVQNHEHFPRESPIPGLLSLDISYTPAPSWIKLIPDYEHDRHTTFWSLAALAFPEHHKENLANPRESNINEVRLPPDEQLLCYDYLYYVCAQQPFELEFDYSPAWRFVGQHLHWSSKVGDLVDEYVRRTLGVPAGAKTPPWVTVHIRHGDFANWCKDVALDECFAPLEAIARRVDEVKMELFDRSGIGADHVIITSDERNATWWEGVRARGWFLVDHSNTVEQHGKWYPVLIDAGIQSMGVGFVGTDRSTMSIMARRRVQSWQSGSVRTVKWGKPGIDDHR